MTHKVNGELLTDPERRAETKSRRDELRDLKLCINGPKASGVPGRRNGVVHGPVVSGGKCQRCIDVHGKRATPVPLSPSLEARITEVASRGGADVMSVLDAAINSALDAEERRN